jgi:hypothetical protein
VKVVQGKALHEFRIMNALQQVCCVSRLCLDLRLTGCLHPCPAHQPSLPAVRCIFLCAPASSSAQARATGTSRKFQKCGNAGRPSDGVARQWWGAEKTCPRSCPLGGASPPVWHRAPGVLLGISARWPAASITCLTTVSTGYAAVPVLQRPLQSHQRAQVSLLRRASSRRLLQARHKGLQERVVPGPLEPPVSFWMVSFWSGLIERTLRMAPPSRLMSAH